jgi:2'-5' RNA ligase
VRMFVAVWPDLATVEGLSELPLGSTEGLRLVAPDRLHVTLRFLGDMEPAVVPPLTVALAAAAEHLVDLVHCRLGPGTAWFGGDRVLHLPVAGLDEAAAVVRTASVPVVPDAAPPPPFAGHLTVARSGRRRLSRSEREALADIPCTAGFEVRSFDLVASHTGSEPAADETLARIHL